MKNVTDFPMRSVLRAANGREEGRAEGAGALVYRQGRQNSASHRQRIELKN